MLTDTELAPTRHALHALAELVLAGSQYAASSRIALRTSPGGFATRYEPALRVAGGAVVADGTTVEVDGRTPRQVCDALGLVLQPLEGVYADGAALGADDVLHLDAAAAAELAAAWEAGDHALRTVAPDADPVLWPEHFDVAITLGEVNLGVSPGDDYLGVPYAYVGPWQVPAGDAFFDAPFGACRPVAQLGDAEAIAAFFAEGLALLH